MKLKILMGLLALVLCYEAAGAQSISIQSDNIRWSINSMTDLDASATVPYQCKFVTFGGQSIDWIQENGNFVLHFTIISTTGNWNDPAENGSITFSIEGEGLQGQLTFSRSIEGVSAALHLLGGNHEINHSYPVQSYEEI